MLLGCEVLAEMENQHVIWGVATTFSQWIFICRTGKHIKMQIVGFDFGDEIQYLPCRSTGEDHTHLVPDPHGCDTTTSTSEQAASALTGSA